MARYRRIKPEFYSNSKVIELSHSARLLFIGLTNFSSDSGVHEYNPKVCKAEIFPADDITIKQVSEYLKELVDYSLIVLNEDGTLLKIKGFERHQKVDKPQPCPYDFVEGKPGQIVNHSDSNRLYSKVKSNETSKIKLKQDGQIQEAFDRLWIIYPKKQKKARCSRVFKALNKTNREACIRGVKRYIKYWELNGTSISHVPMLSSFINDARWDDDLDMSKSQDSLKITPASNRYADMYKNDTEEVLDPKDRATPEEISDILGQYTKGKN